jgi:Cof subfamily protein (haloacid dehalogenase superfamily)
MYSILAVDLDDTIVRRDRTISERTLAALAAWQGTGRRVVIATGRPPRMTRSIPEALHGLPWICYNGAIAFENQEVILERSIHPEHVQLILERLLAADPSATVGLEIDDTLYLNRQSEKYGAQYVADLRTVAHRPAAKILMGLAQYEQTLHELGHLPDGVHVLVSPKYELVQFMPAGVSKATALKMLLARWGASAQEVVAFGDDVNDVEMVGLAGLGIAVANAVEEVKVVAKRVTGSVDEDGVAQVLEELLAVSHPG